MSNKVASQIDIQTIEADAESDIWAEFRQVERIAITLTQSYRYSLGKYSRFFIELEQRRFMATGCPTCGKVYAPPRPACPDCLNVADWVELSGKGEVKTFSILHFSPDANEDVRSLATPYALAYVLLDGADTLFPHLLKAPLEQVHIGMRVRVAWRSQADHPIHLMYFVPTKGEGK